MWCCEDRQAALIVAKPASTCVVPLHRRDLAVGTLGSVLRQAGVDAETRALAGGPSSGLTPICYAADPRSPRQKEVGLLLPLPQTRREATCVRGTRLTTVGDVLGLLASGMSEAELLSS
jgi:hypothetical protein